MRPQEIQAVKWSQLVDEGSYKVFDIDDSLIKMILFCLIAEIKD
ncbi:Uncharacterised protein [Chlamydia trachomatis]|nr:Uncharacterised protein [Chlamydia trachomatis]